MNPTNNVLLIRMLERLSIEVTSENIKYLLIIEGLDENRQRRILNGDTKDGVCHAFWLDNKSWKDSAIESVKSQIYRKGCIESGLNKLLECRPSADQLTTFNEQFILVFNTVFEAEYDGELDIIKKAVSRLLRVYDAPICDIEYINEAKNYQMISRYLVNQASINSGKKILKKTELDDRYNRALLYNNDGEQPHLDNSTALKVISNFFPNAGKTYVKTPQLEQIKAHLAAAASKNTYAIVLIHGMGGVGKSTLAKAVCADLSMNYDAVVWTTYNSEKGLSGIPEQIKVEDLDADLRMKKNALADEKKRVLLVIDNFDEEQSNEALPRWGNTHILVTSRYASSSFELLPEENYLNVSMECDEFLGMDVFENVFSHRSRIQLTDEERESVYALLAEFKFHTYACDILARAISQDRKALRNLRSALGIKIEDYKNAIPGKKLQKASLQVLLEKLFLYEMEGHDSIESDLLHLFVLASAWPKELLLTIAGDNAQKQTMRAFEALQHLCDRNLLQVSTRWLKNYYGDVVEIHPLVSMAVTKKFGDEEFNIVRIMSNIFAVHEDEEKTPALDEDAWPRELKAHIEQAMTLIGIFGGALGYLNMLNEVMNNKHNWPRHFLRTCFPEYNGKDLLLCSTLDADMNRVYFLYIPESNTVKPLLRCESYYAGEMAKNAVTLEELYAVSAPIIIELAVYCTQEETIDIPATVLNKQVEVIRKINVEVPIKTFKMLILPKGLKEIGCGCCELLTAEEVRLPESLGYIGDYAFHFSNIKKAYIPSNVESIGKFAFSNSEIEEVVVAAGGVQLNFGTFMDCENLEKVTFCSNDIMIKDSVFWNCPMLSTITASDEWLLENIDILCGLPAYTTERPEIIAAIIDFNRAQDRMTETVEVDSTDIATLRSM